jgi:hypothetical protein
MLRNVIPKMGEVATVEFVADRAGYVRHALLGILWHQSCGDEGPVGRARQREMMASVSPAGDVFQELL